MIFSEDMMKLVMDGSKTQTRRPVKVNDTIEERRLDLHRCTFGDIPAGVSVVSSYYTRTHAYFVSKASCDLVYRNNRRHWETGQDYAIQPGRGSRGVAGHRIRITGIRLETFASISQADAEAEGFTSPEAFFEKIHALYGKKYDLNSLCWALSFKLVG